MFDILKSIYIYAMHLIVLMGKYYSQCQNQFLICKTHHAGECEQRCLDLRHVAVLKQVVGFEDVMRLQAIHCDGFDEVCQVLQLKATPIQTRLTTKCVHRIFNFYVLFADHPKMFFLGRPRPIAVKTACVCSSRPVLNEGSVLCHDRQETSFKNRSKAVAIKATRSLQHCQHASITMSQHDSVC